MLQIEMFSKISFHRNIKTSAKYLDKQLGEHKVVLSLQSSPCAINSAFVTND